jgi:hypothetical protein
MNSSPYTVNDFLIIRLFDHKSKNQKITTVTHPLIDLQRSERRRLVTSSLRLCSAPLRVLHSLLAALRHCRQHHVGTDWSRSPHFSTSNTTTKENDNV